MAVQSEHAGAEYPESAITRPFPFNALLSGGRGARGRRRDLPARNRRPGRQQGAVDARRALRAAAGDRRSPATSASRAGARSAHGRACGCREFLKRIGADTRAKYVWFQCAEGYSNTIDMATALHPQTQLTFKFDDQILPRKYGFPMKMPHADQARLQEPEIHHRDRTCRTTTPAATGRTRATTGSAGSSPSKSAPTPPTVSADARRPAAQR